MKSRRPAESRAQPAPERGATTVVVYGRRAVLEALAEINARAVEVEHVRVSRDAPGEFRKELASAARARGLSLEVTSVAGVHELSADARNDQGVAARVRLLNITELDSFIASSKGAGARKAARALALDGITNPQNVGMIVRSAAAAGMSALLWPTVGSPWISGLVVKASASTVFRAPIVRCGALQEALYELKGAGFSLVGLAGNADRSLFEHTPPHRACYVVGSETVGISPSVAETLDETLSIPMRNGVESLNAAVAAALLCFHCAP